MLTQKFNNYLENSKNSLNGFIRDKKLRPKICRRSN